MRKPIPPGGRFLPGTPTFAAIIWVRPSTGIDLDFYPTQARAEEVLLHARFTQVEERANGDTIWENAYGYKAVAGTRKILP